MIAVRDHLDQFDDAMIVVVTFATPDRLAAYQDHLSVPFTILSDVNLQLYHLFGAERGTNRQVWSWRTLRMYARLLRTGRRLQRPTEDVHQMGADAVIGRDGVLRYLSLPATPSARPPLDELIQALD